MKCVVSWHEKTIEDRAFLNDDFKESRLEGVVFTRCSFDKCDFRKARFENVRFNSCFLNGVLLAGASLDQVFFKESKLTGVDFIQINRHFVSLVFEECKLAWCNFSSLKIPRTIFRKSMLEGADFVETDLSFADFRESEFSDCRFAQAKCEQADFRGAHGVFIDPLTTSVRGAKFSLEGALALLGAFEVEVEY